MYYCKNYKEKQQVYITELKTAGKGITDEKRNKKNNWYSACAGIVINLYISQVTL